MNKASCVMTWIKGVSFKEIRFPMIARRDRSIAWLPERPLVEVEDEHPPCT